MSQNQIVSHLRAIESQPRVWRGYISLSERPDRRSNFKSAPYHDILPRRILNRIERGKKDNLRLEDTQPTTIDPTLPNVFVPQVSEFQPFLHVESQFRLDRVSSLLEINDGTISGTSITTYANLRCEDVTWSDSLDGNGGRGQIKFLNILMHLGRSITWDKSIEHTKCKMFKPQMPV